MMPPLEPPPLTNLRRFFLHFGPFDEPLADEIAYCKAAIAILDDGPCAILTRMDENRLDNHAVLVLYSDEDPNDYMDAIGEIENVEEIALTVFRKQIEKLEKGERDRGCEFYLPNNYLPPHYRPVYHLGGSSANRQGRFPID